MVNCILIIIIWDLTFTKAKLKWLIAMIENVVSCLLQDQSSVVTMYKYLAI